jgi:hypothetical protein
MLSIRHADYCCCSHCYCYCTAIVVSYGISNVCCMKFHFAPYLLNGSTVTLQLQIAACTTKVRYAYTTWSQFHHCAAQHSLGYSQQLITTDQLVESCATPWQWPEQRSKPWNASTHHDRRTINSTLTPAACRCAVNALKRLCACADDYKQCIVIIMYYLAQ